jgi:hypothetical protein
MVYAWELNDQEQTGILLRSYRIDTCFIKTPTVVPGLQDKGKAVRIAAAKGHTLVLLDDGTITSLGTANTSRTVAQLSTGVIREFHELNGDDYSSCHSASVDDLCCSLDKVTLEVLDVEHASSDDLFNQSNIPSDVVTALVVYDGANSTRAISADYIPVQKGGVIHIHRLARQHVNDECFLRIEEWQVMEKGSLGCCLYKQETNISDVREIAAGPNVDLALTGDGHVFLRVAGGCCVWKEQSYRGLTIVPGMVLAVPQKQLLVLDLNGALIDKASWTPRPYLGDFLEFVFTHFDVMVWSSGMPRTVEKMLDLFFGTYKSRLVKIWTRDNFELTPEQYKSKCLTIKDLSKVWADCDGQYSAHNTILVDNSEEKAQKQPANLVLVSTFEPGQADIDEELKNIIEYLIFLIQEDDVRDYIGFKRYK